MKRAFKYAIFLTILALFPQFSSAAEIITDDSVNIADDQVISENLYIGSGRAHLFGKSLKDTTVVAGQSILAGEYVEDVTVISGASFSDGVFGEDLKAVGSNVTVSGKVSGDLLIVGGTVKIEKRAELNGDVIIVAGTLVSKGQIKGDAKIVSGSVDIDGVVEGDMVVTTQNLEFGPEAEVSGIVNYFAPKKVELLEGTIISGDLIYNQINSIRESQVVERAVLNFFNFWMVLKFITTLVIAFLLIYIFKYFSQQIARSSKKSFLKMFVIGLLSLFLVPIISLVFLISLFALPLGIILMLFYGVVLLLSPAISGIILGFIVWKWIRPKDDIKVSFQTATLGVIILTLLQFIPYVGGLIKFIFFVVSVGAVYYYIIQRVRGNI